MTTATTRDTGKDRWAGSARVIGHGSRAAMAQAAAEEVAEVLRAALSRRDTARMVFAAAPSQAEIVEELAAAPDIDWGRVTAFHMDEYIGLPKDAPQRFALWLDRHLFSRLPFGTVHPLHPDPDPHVASAEYARRLAEAPIDIVCLGIGNNGHIAFNDPPIADFDDPADVKVVELDRSCRQQQVDDECFAALDTVPTHAITLTVPRLLRADRLVCTVPGRRKRDAVKAALNGPIETACPASILRTHPACTIHLDPEADPDA